MHRRNTLIILLLSPLNAKKGGKNQTKNIIFDTYDRPKNYQSDETRLFFFNVAKVIFLIDPPNKRLM